MSKALWASLVGVVMFVAYNANGREISSYDSQPPKFAAIEFARSGSLTLDPVIARTPAYAERPAFVVDREGHYRSAYPPLPSILAGAVAASLRATGLVDLDAPLAPALVAKISASLLTSLAVVLAFLTARLRLPLSQALAVAFGFGLGTDLWAQTSQTLWQSETAVLALCGAVLALARPASTLQDRHLWIASLLLGVAGATRAQLAPAILILAIGCVVRRRRRADVVFLLPLILIACGTVVLNMHWFDHPFGARLQLEAAATAAHAVDGVVGSPLEGLAGLLVSPSRGLLIFSPIVLMVIGAAPFLRRHQRQDDLPWLATAAAVQLGAYASYSAWWGGHSYGPRLCVDILPMLVPLASAGASVLLGTRLMRGVFAILLAWSILVAGTGAFVYPHDAWNTDPAEVDTNHDRLWDWRDPQFLRAWQAGLSPQNFALFDRHAFRVD